MSMIEALKFHERAAITGKSFDSRVLIMNFSDKHIITLAYVLETPLEVTSLCFHPENPNVLFGGCLNGQIVMWDLSNTDYRLSSSAKKGNDADEENDEKNNEIIKMKHSMTSSIIVSHKNFVSDIQFIPG